MKNITHYTNHIKHHLIFFFQNLNVIQSIMQSSHDIVHKKSNIKHSVITFEKNTSEIKKIFTHLTSQTTLDTTHLLHLKKPEGQVLTVQSSHCISQLTQETLMSGVEILNVSTITTSGGVNLLFQTYGVLL